MERFFSMCFSSTPSRTAFRRSCLRCIAFRLEDMARHARGETSARSLFTLVGSFRVGFARPCARDAEKGLLQPRWLPESTSELAIHRAAGGPWRTLADCMDDWSNGRFRHGKSMPVGAVGATRAAAGCDGGDRGNVLPEHLSRRTTFGRATETKVDQVPADG